jgi:hypothetical protein
MMVGAPLIAGGLVGLVLVLLAPVLAPGDPTGVSRAAASAEAAIGEYIASEGAIYAGPCERARSPEDIGKLCSRFIADRGTLSAYLTGRTFSEFNRWLFVAASGYDWSVAADAPLDFHAQSAEPPWPW